MQQLLQDNEVRKRVRRGRVKKAASRYCYGAAVHSCNLTEGPGEVQLKKSMKGMWKRRWWLPREGRWKPLEPFSW